MHSLAVSECIIAAYERSYTQYINYIYCVRSARCWWLMLMTLMMMMMVVRGAIADCSKYNDVLA